MATPAGVLQIFVTANTAAANAALAKTQGQLTATGKTATATGATMKKAFLGIGVAAGAAGVALFKVGEEFDSAYDTISTRTGATGKELDKLKNAFRGVVGSVPADFDDASKAVGGLKQRLDLTGKPLRDMSRQMLELSRLTGTDIDANVRNVSRAFVDWEVKTRDQAKTLDGFFRLSQKSGISVDELSESVQRFGSPLRQLGFTLDEAAAMFATFEKAGVNSQTMVPGFKLAISNLTRPTDELAASMKKMGIEVGKPDVALRQIFELLGKESTLSQIQKTGLAMDVFGKRAGADMAEAIKQGRFELDDMIKVMGGAEGAIREQGRRTMDLNEHWQKFANNLKLMVEPIATDVFEGLGRLMRDVTTTFKKEGLTGVLDLLTQKLSDATPKVLEAGKDMAVALINGLLNSGIWGKLLLAATIWKTLGSRIGTSLGGGIKGGLAGIGIAGAITAAFMIAERIAHPFGERVAEAFGAAFKPAMEKAIQQASIPALRELSNEAHRTARGIRALDWEGSDEAADKIERFSERGRAAMVKLEAKIRDLRERFQQLRNSTTQDLGDIQESTEKNLSRIEKSLGTHSEAGRAAVKRNFGAAIAAIKKAMKDGRIATDAGGQAIADMIRQRLKMFGVTGPDAEKIIKVGTPGSDVGGKHIGGLQKGGVVSGHGAGDKVPVTAMLEPGEIFAVLNRNAASVINAMNERLPRFAKGGFVDPAGPGTGVVNPAIAGVVGRWSQQYNAAINYGYDPGGGHVSPGHNVTGTATDTSPAGGWAGKSLALFERGLRAIVGKVDQVLYGTDGIGTPYPNHGRGNHAHIEWGMHPDVVAGITGRFKLPRFVGRYAQGSMGAAGLNRVSAAMEKIMAARVAAMGGGPDAGAMSAGGQFSKTELMRLWTAVNKGQGDPNLMAAIALAESGGDPRAVSYAGARGLWQIMPFHGGGDKLFEPAFNAMKAGEVLASQGLGAWDVYTGRGGGGRSYLQFLQRGGMVPYLGKFHSGGVAARDGMAHVQRGERITPRQEKEWDKLIHEQLKGIREELREERRLNRQSRRVLREQGKRWMLDAMGEEIGSAAVRNSRYAGTGQLTRIGGKRD